MCCSCTDVLLLLLRAQAFIKDNVTGFQPRPDDLAYPAKLEAATAALAAGGAEIAEGDAPEGEEEEVEAKVCACTGRAQFAESWKPRNTRAECRQLAARACGLQCTEEAQGCGGMHVQYAGVNDTIVSLSPLSLSLSLLSWGN